tara:strand:+ start:2083 stop:3822 length:1740 start_codon:yes stop_codon:yes gene_type:complete
MINLSQLNKLILTTFFFSILIFNVGFSDTAVDIWKKQENKKSPDDPINTEEIIIKSPILSSNENTESENISELELDQHEQTIIGLFDPKDNNFDIGMWLDTDGSDIKSIFKRIDKLQLSEFSEDLLFKVLFTNAYPPKKNMTSAEFLKIKIDWLIKHRRLQDLENLLLTNPAAGKEPSAIKFLINERLSNAEIKSACEKVSAIDKNVQNNYLEKFKIYCFINTDREDEAQLLFELLKERGFKDDFFEDKINYLLGFKEKTNQKIVDNNLFNFYLYQITAEDFNYQPNEKTDKYIWRYLSSSNLIQINDFEDEKVILTYEKAAEEDSFKSEEIFNIYKQILFNVNQLINADEVYKNLPNYKARALIYQSILLSDNVEKKLNLIFLLKGLFEEDKLTNVYSKELTKILRNIDSDKIPESYKEIVEINIEENFKEKKKIKFDNDILHRSKVIKHFLDDNNKINKTKKDFKSVYKKIKKNKKYFISIMDIIVLESLVVDGMSLPNDLNFNELSSQLTVPKNLQDLVNQNQLGLVMLKIIEIIGEDSIPDLDPETIYFLNKILNDLNLKKIRNDVLSQALPVRV